jgi:KDO2-lipid IV(A) lauroyltransferase
MAALGAQRFPRWWLRYSPPVIGVAAAVALPRARRAVQANLRRVRGPRGPIAEALDTARTFSTFAGGLAETLAKGSPNDGPIDTTLVGGDHMRGAIDAGKGLVLVTAHTGGWEATGVLLTKEIGVPVVIAMQREPDERARAIHDRAREAIGVRVVHVGDGPLESLPLLYHLKSGGAVALQLDRTPPGMRTRAVELFGQPGRIPDGPLRLAQLTGAPIVALFSQRLGFRRYRVQAEAPLEVPRRASEAELDRIAQRLADAMSAFLSAHPTQWLQFEPPDA